MHLRDHPRSRGVYGFTAGAPGKGNGSSPLARGLRGTATLGNGGTGIIPARAGFTPRGRGRRRLPRDHPRSRGVYERNALNSPVQGGSSPLARGLRSRSGLRAPSSRIIPARAGFTMTIMSPGRSSADHPRSRGVYQTVDELAINELGSSPLARGLPPREGAPLNPYRIIPARAGFTRKAHGCGAAPTDHPRSRGVYLVSGESEKRRPGSSPLARGLRLEHVQPR